MPSKKSTGDSGRKKSGPALTGPQSRAVAVVLTACASMSSHIAIVGWNPPRTVPEDALRMTLGEIGISDLEELRELLKTLMPEGMGAGVDKVEIKSGTRLGELAEALAAGQ